MLITPQVAWHMCKSIMQAKCLGMLALTRVYTYVHFYRIRVVTDSSTDRSHCHTKLIPSRQETGYVKPVGVVKPCELLRLNAGCFLQVQIHRMLAGRGIVKINRAANTNVIYVSKLNQGVSKKSI